MVSPDLSKPRPKARSSTAKAKKDASGLGRAIINRRAKEQKRIYEEALHNTELPSGLNSVTQENDLDEFLNTAQLAATDFSAGPARKAIVCKMLMLNCRTQNGRISKSSPRQVSSSSIIHICSRIKRSVNYSNVMQQIGNAYECRGGRRGAEACPRRN
ncbi:hypothetical protein EMMF5_001963 [Cystobasidiomycetes sp. EMM_F5]